MKISKVTFIILLLFNYSVLTSSISGNSDLYVNENSNEEADEKSLEGIIFFVENNKINDESIFLDSMEEGFSKDLVKSIIQYKKNKFNKAYELLFANINQKNTNPKYFEYLVKTANIVDKLNDLESYINKSNREKELIYLDGLIDYFNADYQSAKDKFLSAYKENISSVEIMIYLSNVYRLGDYKKAGEYLDSAKKIVQSSDQFYSQIIIAKGSLHFLSGDYDRAKELYSRGLEAARISSNNIEIIKAELNLAMINDINGEIKTARKLFENAYNLAVKINQEELGATVLSEWAVSFTYTNEPIEARNKYEESFQIFQLLKNKERIAITANNIANLFLNIGNYKAALESYELALDYAGQDVRTKMIALRGKADVYTNLSNYSKALHLYNEAKKISKEIKDINSEVEINSGLGILYYNLGESENALGLMLEQYDAIDKDNNPYLKAELDQKIGIIYFSLQDYGSAEKYLLSSIQLSEKHNDLYSSILSNTYLAYSYINNDKLNDGGNILREQLRLSKNYDLNQLASTQLLILSEIDHSKNKVQLLNEALKFAIGAKDNINTIETYYKLAKYFIDDQQFDSAEKYLKQGIMLIENQISSLRTLGSLQINYYTNHIQIYNSLIDLYLKQNEVGKAFFILDKSRSRNTLYNLTAIKLAEDQEIEQINKFYDEHWKLSNGLFEKSKIDSLQDNLNQIEKKIINKYPNLLSLNNLGEKFSYNTNFELLDKNEYFLNYYIYSDSIYVFVVSNKKLELINLKTSKIELEDLISSISPYYNQTITNKDIHFNNDLFSFNPDNSQKLFNKILKPIIDRFPIGSRIIFSSPAEFRGIPFEFLCSADRKNSVSNYYASKRFMIEDYSISYSPSFTVWKELKNRSSSSNKTALLIGDPKIEFAENEFSEFRGVKDLDFYSRNIRMSPLKYSAKEIEDLDDLFSNDIIFLGEEATETNFKTKSVSASVIHVSTHSFLFKNYPVVIFSGDEQNDGYLETGEVAGLKLNSDMVVLSSCKSGLGEKNNAEGILGMQKAFFDAGASSILLSLWDVSDKQTSLFMKFFYEFLSENIDKSEALRKAKVKFITEVDPNPYYWAAFTLAGNSNSIDFEKQSNNFYYLLGILVLIMLGYALYKKENLIKKMETAD